MCSKYKGRYVREKKYNPTCHYCHTRGHTQPECYIFYKEQREAKYQMKNITSCKRHIWVRKTNMVCYPTIVMSAALTESRWYFDKGCSRHMTGNVSHLSSVISHSGSVRFGYGQKGKIIGIGTLDVPGLPHLDDVLLVQGLKQIL